MSEAVETHQPCPDCGSSDALAVYDDGHTHCFSCGKTKGKKRGRSVHSGDAVGRSSDSSGDRSNRLHTRLKPLISPGDFQALPKRKIHEETARKFGYTVGKFSGKTVQIAPYYSGGKLVAQKLRFANKEFTVRGNIKEADLFGQHLWKAGGKRLVITEGEIDAMSYAQATNLSWPVVSVPQGAQSAKKSIQKNIEYVESFEQVVFLFDMDEPGQKAAKECAELLSPGKAAIARMPLKDANEMLKHGRVKELLQAVWNAPTVRPDGVVNASEIWDRVSKPVEMGTPYPWNGLNRILYGLRPREIVTFSAGTGIGKSAVCAEIGYHLAQNLDQTVGYVALEEGIDRTGLRFMGIHADQPLHLPGHTVSEEEMRRIFEETLGTGKYWLYDHFGSLDSDNLLAKLKYLVKGCGARWLILDHLSIIVSGMDPDEDERRALDRTMTKLRSFTEETGAGLILVSHLKRPEGRGHEDGAQTHLSQLRGSAAIGQLSDAVIGLERNQQSGDDEDRNTTIVRVLKNRYAGETGVAAALRYSYETGRLNEIPFVVNEDGSIETNPSSDDFEETGMEDEELPF